MYTFSYRYEDADGNSDDIAILKLPYPVNSSLAIPLCQKSYLDSGNPIAVCGVGKLKSNSSEYPEVLQEVILSEALGDDCAFDFNETRQICMIPQQGTNTFPVFTPPLSFYIEKI